MARSRKKEPVCYLSGNDTQKKGKQMSSRKFRRKEHQAVSSGDYDRAPMRQHEVMKPWDLGCEGHSRCDGMEPEYIEKIMRK